IFRNVVMLLTADFVQNAAVMTEVEALKARTKQFALDVIRLVRRFPRTVDGEVVGRQLNQVRNVGRRELPSRVSFALPFGFRREDIGRL
ncbi:MAG TPA: hypothetical protein VFZ73_09550, partial [Gemmatimonadaceae bacterium]